MKIAFGSDHGGFELKEILKKYAEEMGHTITDFGTHVEESVDYPVFAIPVAEAVAKNEYDRGVVVCGTGIGASIAANKVKGIRCALTHDLFSAEATRAHNNSNVLALGGRVVKEDLAKEILKVWLETEFEGGRHLNRINLIKEYEEKQ